jgi:thiol-disulfide isomerase/thioredoxin
LYSLGVRRGWVLGASLLLGCAGVTGRSGLDEPFELVVQDLWGARVDVAAFGGVRVVEFWATWCEPCMAQRPALEAFAQEVEGDGVRVLAVSIDEDVGRLQGHLLQRPTSLEVLWDPSGEASERYIRYRVGFILPTTIVVDGNNRIINRYTGTDDELPARIDGDIAGIEAGR